MTIPALDSLCLIAAASGLVVVYVPPRVNATGYPTGAPYMLTTARDPR